MKNISKKNIVKIPNHVKIIYSIKENFLIVFGRLEKRSLHLKLQMCLDKKSKLLKITAIFSNIVSKSVFKKLKALRRTAVIQIQQFMAEISSFFHRRLRFIGIGYKVSCTDKYIQNFLALKLGFSHLLYFMPRKKANILCFKTTSIFIYGSSLNEIAQISAKIRSLKQPEPYKGKGILYQNEDVILKKGKNI